MGYDNWLEAPYHAEDARADELESRVAAALEIWPDGIDLDRYDYWRDGNDDTEESRRDWLLETLGDC